MKRLLILAALLLACASPAAAQGVQSQAAVCISNNSSAANSLALAYGSNVTVGHTLGAFVGWETKSVSLASPALTDSVSTTYGTPIVQNSSADMALALILGIAGGTGANTVTVHWASNVTWRRMCIFEYQAMSATVIVDATSRSAQSGTNPTLGTVTTVTNDELILAGIDSDSSSSTYTAGAGFTLRGQANGADSVAFEDANKAVAGSISATMTVSNNQSLACIVVALRSAASAVPPLALKTLAVAHGNVGTSYSQSMTVFGGVAPYTWAVTSGALPAGLTLSSGGTISGTPTTVATSTMTIRVTDTASTTASKTFTTQTFNIPQQDPTYPGMTSLTYNVTGYFHTEKRTINARSQWVMVNPNGHPMIYVSVQNASTARNFGQGKYASGAESAHARNARLLYQGFTGLGAYISNSGIAANDSIKVPYMVFLSTSQDNGPRVECQIAEPIKNIFQSTLRPSWMSGPDGQGVLDYYASTWPTCATNQVLFWTNKIPGVATDPYVLGWQIDDVDLNASFKGYGVNGPIQNYKNIGFAIATERYISTGTETDKLNHSKYSWIDYLKTLYANPAAVSTAWSRTPAYVGWDDRTDTCTYSTGTCVIDEDGLHNAFGPATDSIAYTLAGINATLKTDILNFQRKFVKNYAVAIVNAIRAQDTNHLIFGGDAINNYGMNNWDATWLGLADAAIQVVETNYDPGTGVDGGTPARGADAGVMTNNNRMYDVMCTVACTPVIMWYSVNAQKDSVMNAAAVSYGSPNTFSQAIRGTQIRDTDLPVFLAAKGTINQDFYALGFDWWEAWDNAGDCGTPAGEQLNWGLGTLCDNRYDGKESVSATVLCGPPLDGSITIQGQTVGPYNCGGEPEVTRTGVSFNANGSASNGDGAAVTFAINFRYPGVKPSTLAIQVGGVTQCTDNGAGSLTGAGCSGTITYATSVGSVTFNSAPGNGVALAGNYTSQTFGDFTTALEKGIANMWTTVFGVPPVGSGIKLSVTGKIVVTGPLVIP